MCPGNEKTEIRKQQAWLKQAFFNPNSFKVAPDAFSLKINRERRKFYAESEKLSFKAVARSLCE